MSVELDGAIALSLGWTELRPTHFSEVHDLMGKAPNGRIMLVPRWSSDLNAMWELEDRAGDIWDKYREKLKEIVFSGPSFMSIIHATAEQKARAFLAVHGEANHE